jgi:hypothetical protein
MVLDLGATPLANALQKPDAPRTADGLYPLAVVFCSGCGLLQTTETIPPEAIFADDYPYYSSTSAALVRHARDNVESLIAARRLNERSFVIELASNDGYLLRHFVERGIPVLGIDPAEGPVTAARAAGVPTLQAFFSREVAEKLVRERGPADVLIANNVLAHVPDTNGFVGAIATALKKGGTAVIEFPYVVDMVDACEFDTIYHEHVFYFSLTALQNLFGRHGLHLNDAVPLSIHGGSLRIFASHEPGRSKRLAKLLETEKQRGVDRFEYYRDFAGRVKELADRIADMLRRLRAKGARIAAYGAAAKGATLLNYIKPEPGTIEYVVDRNPHKQGKIMPGLQLRILPCETLAADRPDYTLLLSWNFAEEILREQSRYLALGGRFIIPVPRPRIVGGAGAATSVSAHAAE